MRWLLVHNAVATEAAPDEADVLVQAAAVQAELERQGHTVRRFACDLNLAALRDELVREPVDAVFNLVESLGGHGRLIHLVPDCLEALGVAFTGSCAGAVYLTSHKTMAKECLSAAGLPTAAWLGADGNLHGGPGTGRWIIKSIWEDASLGLDDDALVAGEVRAVAPLLAARAGRQGAPWFAEAYIEGREFNVAILDGPQGPQVLPPAEMLFQDFPPDKPRIVGYAAKWHEDSFEYSHTVRSFAFDDADRELLQELVRLSEACWTACGLRGWARVDYRVNAVGRPFILEVNANPCLSADAGFAAALDRAGVTFAEALERIVATAG